MSIEVFITLLLMSVIGTLLVRYLAEKTYPTKRKQTPFQVKIPQDPDVKDLLSKPEKLDVMYYLSRGFSIEETATKMERTHSFVKKLDTLLGTYGLLTDTRWGIDAEALGMKKILKIYPDSEYVRDQLLSDDFFITYLVQARKEKEFLVTIYTFPEESEEEIGGISISDWYYTFPRFTVPFFKENLFEEFFNEYNSISNESPFPPRGTPLQDVDLIDIYICKWAQIWPEFDKEKDKLTVTIKEEIEDLIDVSYNLVKDRINILKEKNIIFPINPLFLKRLGYNALMSIINHQKIFRVVKTFSQFNIMSALCFISEEKYGLWLHYPHEHEKSILQILNNLDSHNETYLLSDALIRTTIPYKYFPNKARGIPYEGD